MASRPCEYWDHEFGSGKRHFYSPGRHSCTHSIGMALAKVATLPSGPIWCWCISSKFPGAHLIVHTGHQGDWARCEVVPPYKIIARFRGKLVKFGHPPKMQSPGGKIA